MKPFISQLCCLLVCVGVSAFAVSAQGKPSLSSSAADGAPPAAAVAPPVLSPTHFRIGEKLSYAIAFGKFTNAAYAEMSVVSRGTLSGRDAIELRSKLKTLELVNATFFQWDETRTVFVEPESGLPLFVTKRLHNGMTPEESSVTYLKAGATSFDMLSLMYKARETGGNGSFSLFENEKMYTVTLRSTKSEHIRTDAGDFETVISIVESDYLEAKGVKECRIYFSDDADHIPVLFRMKTSRGEFKDSLIAIQHPKAVAVVPPAPVPGVTPGGKPTPRPKPTATPYIENQPLAPELGFDLGESLEYNVTAKGGAIGAITLEAKERKLVQNVDTLLLAATVTRVEPTSRAFILGDFVHAYVDPETLAPRMIESKFSGEFHWLNQTVGFDGRTGGISVNGGAPVEAPIGTHTLLSLIYAMRSFNLKPSKDPSNPVNDTRVAVFWDSHPFVFTLRPSSADAIVINGDKVPAQLIRISTGNEMLDKANLRVWLSANGRVPLRFAAGEYQADLITKRSL